MANNTPAQPSEASQSTEAAFGRPTVIHALQDLPESLGQVSKGPLGPVARKDHRSWSTKSITHPAYWSGRLDSALHERLQERPVPGIALCFVIGAIAGAIVGSVTRPND